MTRALRRLGRFLLHVARRFDEVRCLQIASSLTFTTLLALVPLVTIALTLMSAFPVFSGLGEHIHQFLLANMLPEAAGKVVTGYIEQFSGRAGRLTALGTAVLAVTAFMMMFTIERAFNSIWRVSRARRSSDSRLSCSPARRSHFSTMWCRIARSGCATHFWEASSRRLRSRS